MRYQYSRGTKQEAVRRVVEDRQPVARVAREMRIGEGSVFFWVRRHREATSRGSASGRLLDTIKRLERRLQELQGVETPHSP